MTEEMSREKAEWSPQWLTIREFSHITPVNLFHKEQEEGEKQPGAEQQLAEEFRKNLHVLVRARFTLETAQENLTLRLTADDHYKLYVESGFVAEGPAPGYPDHYYYNEIPLGKMEAGEHCFGLHLYYQGLINRVYNSGDLRFAFAAELMDAQGCRIPLRFCYEDGAVRNLRMPDGRRRLRQSGRLTGCIYSRRGCFAGSASSRKKSRSMRMAASGSMWERKSPEACA